MNKLLCGSLALMLASVTFAAPRDPATGSTTSGKHRGKHHRGKKSKGSGTNSKSGSTPQADGQPATK